MMACEKSYILLLIEQNAINVLLEDCKIVLLGAYLQPNCCVEKGSLIKVISN